MKIRIGFVSNSSTCSFMLLGWKYRDFSEKFEGHIQDMIFDLYKAKGVDYTKDSLINLSTNIGDCEGLSEELISEIAKDVCELDVETFNAKYKDIEFSTYGEKESVVSLFTEEHFLSYDEYCLPLKIIPDDFNEYYIAIRSEEVDDTLVWPVSSIIKMYSDKNEDEVVDIFKKYCSGDLDLDVIFTVMEC